MKFEKLNPKLEGETLINEIRKNLQEYEAKINAVSNINDLLGEEKDIVASITENDQRLDKVNFKMSDNKNVSTKEAFTYLKDLFDNKMKAKFSDVERVTQLFDCINDAIRHPEDTILTYTQLDDIVRTLNQFTYEGYNECLNASHLNAYFSTYTSVYNDCCNSRIYYDELHKIVLKKAKVLNPSLDIPQNV